MAVRPETLASREDLIAAVRARLDDKPLLPLDDLAGQLDWCRRSIQRALNEAGTSYRHEQRVPRLDSAAQLFPANDWLDGHPGLLRPELAGGLRTRDI